MGAVWRGWLLDALLHLDCSPLDVHREAVQSLLQNEADPAEQKQLEQEAPAEKHCSRLLRCKCETDRGVTDGSGVSEPSELSLDPAGLLRNTLLAAELRTREA